MLRQVSQLAARSLVAPSARFASPTASRAFYSTDAPVEESVDPQAVTEERRQFTIPVNPPTFAHVYLSGFLSRKPFFSQSPNNRKYARITVGVRARLSSGRYVTNHYPVLVFDEETLNRLAHADSTTAVTIDGSLRIGERLAGSPEPPRNSPPNYVIISERLLMWTGRPRKEGDVPPSVEGQEAPAEGSQ